MTDATVFRIARCPEHGLHGERSECFVCGGPVEQVEMVEASRLAACAERGETLEAALRDEIAMAEQSAETLRDLHRNWRDLAETLTPDGEPLIQNMLYWLIEDVEPSAAREALAGAAPYACTERNETLEAVARDMLSVTPAITDCESKLEDIALFLDAVDKRRGRVGQTEMQDDLRGWAASLRAALSGAAPEPEHRGSRA